MLYCGWKCNMTNFEKLTQIIAKNKGYITRMDVDNEGISSWFLTYYVRKMKLVKIDKGFYAANNWFIDPFLVFQYKYPKYIYSFDSASYLLGMSDIIPPYLEVTGPQNYRPYAKKRKGIITHTDTKDNTYQLGIITVVDPYNYQIKCYSVEKTICDFIKNRESVSSEQFSKVIGTYRQTKKKDLNQLMSIASAMKILKKVQDILEVIGNE